MTMASSSRSAAAKAMRAVRTNEQSSASEPASKPSVKISDLHFQVDAEVERRVADERRNNRQKLKLDE
jgi:hypothetical protein